MYTCYPPCIYKFGSGYNSVIKTFADWELNNGIYTYVQKVLGQTSKFRRRKCRSPSDLLISFLANLPVTEGMRKELKSISGFCSPFVSSVFLGHKSRGSTKARNWRAEKA